MANHSFDDEHNIIGTLGMDDFEGLSSSSPSPEQSALPGQLQTRLTSVLL